MMRMLQTLRRRMNGEGGFTIVEAMISISILAVGAFAVAQAMMFGLSTTGLSRQKLSSRAAVDQQMEEARALNYDNLVLSDPAALTHSADTTNPDYWVNASAQTYDPDGSGPLAAEPLVRVAGASPALEHYQNPLLDGATTYEVYRYVTWVDSPQDGTGEASNTDGNKDGVNEGAHDAKRVTVVVVWNDELGRGNTSLAESSLFSDGQITYKAPTTNAAPSVSCPTASVADKTVTFTANASDSDGTIASVAWNFGDSATATGASVTHTYAAYTTYTVVNTVTDNGGSTASNSAAGCTVTTVSPTAGNGGPDGTVSINAGATYTNSTTVTLSLAKAAGTEPCDDEAVERQLDVARAVRLRHLLHVDRARGRRHEDRLRALLQRRGPVRSDRERHDHARHGCPRHPDELREVQYHDQRREHDHHVHLGGARRRHRPRRLPRVPAADHLDRRILAGLRHLGSDL